MKKLTLIILVLLLGTSLFAQKNKEEQAIVDEGKRLYQSEIVSWYGTDLFLERYPEERNNIGGYFSYADNESVKCIFFSNTENPKVIATITFDKTFDINKATIDRKERVFTSYENDIYAIRKAAYSEINSDSLFKLYNNTNFNLIPLINGNEKKVYVLTGPEQTGVVIFGNDYLLIFDKNNKVKSKKQLHKNIIPVEYSKDGKIMDMDVKSSVHSHLPETGDLITATDICTLMLYQDFAKWESHMVIGEKNVSIWSCKSNSLAVISRSAFEKGFKKD